MQRQKTISSNAIGVILAILVVSTLAFGWAVAQVTITEIIDAAGYATPAGATERRGLT